jgi:hypothetical protein
MPIMRGMRCSAATTALWALAVTGLVAACTNGHDNGIAPKQPIVSDAQIESDVATAAGGEIASDIADFSSADTGGQAGLLFTSRPSAALSHSTSRTLGARTACTQNSATFQLVYSGSDTLNIGLTWFYFGAEGCESTFSTSTTDSIAYTSVDSLHINGSGWVKHSIRDRASSVAGSGGSSLSNDTVHIWNGVGQGTDTSTYTGSPAARAYTGAASDTGVAITFAHPRNGELFPDTGTVSLWYNWTLTVTGPNAENVTVVRHVLATLNGSNDVPLQVFNPSSSTLELTCTLDLTAHRVVTGSCH